MYSTIVDELQLRICVTFAKVIEQSKHIAFKTTIECTYRGTLWNTKTCFLPF